MKLKRTVNNVDSFPLNIKKIFEDYTRIPYGTSNIFYHYTTHDGLHGILRRGGLRATYRMRMNDNMEFTYGRETIFRELDTRIYL